MFYGLALVGIFGGVVFTLIGSGESTEWGKYQTLPDIEEAEDELKPLKDEEKSLKGNP